jgi:short-subunit dehydrogenase
MNIIITGGSRGMGKAMAFEFAATASHIILCARNLERLESTKNEIIQKFPACTIDVFSVDLSIKSEVKRFADFCLHKFTPDILINNAGTYTPGNTMDGNDENLENMMHLNFYSAFYLTKHLLPSMIHQKRGHIFNICSIAALRAYDGGGTYSISKFALNGLSQNLRHELKPHGIKVTAVFPGAVLTDSWGDFDNSNHRIMEASDIAKMVFAASTLSPQAVVEEIIIRPQLGDL